MRPDTSFFKAAIRAFIKKDPSPLVDFRVCGTQPQVVSEATKDALWVWVYCRLEKKELGPHLLGIHWRPYRAVTKAHLPRALSLEELRQVCITGIDSQIGTAWAEIPDEEKQNWTVCTVERIHADRLESSDPLVSAD